MRIFLKSSKARVGLKETGQSLEVLQGQLSEYRMLTMHYGFIVTYWAMMKLFLMALKRFEDFAGVPGGNHEFRRVILRSNKNRRGAFCRLLGDTELELVEVKDRAPHKIFRDRYWGDLGYIHICFDINGMANLADRCKQANFSFTVDSRDSFDMGKAAGHFSYCEDPDGTLIEFVETHKIPIIEKIGWYLNIRNRNPDKPLPDWMLNMLSLNRVRD